ncbi:hypothetical protein [Streptomyces sp. NPDC018031]|uniref:hypothetical protein n=1 Tax=Streptomyces sp. NPDC018031 TaxID=3365033 RepID=UPI0037BBFE45
MVFPDSRYELYIGGAWVDVTADVRISAPTAIRRGRSDGGARVDPASCTLTLNNRHGRYSPRNPMSPYYGAIGRNTPLRVSVRAGSTHLDIPAAGARATTPDVPALDITGDIDVRVDLQLTNWEDFALVELAAKQDLATNQRSWRLMKLADDKIEFTWTVDGTNATLVNVASTVAPALPASGRIAVRATLDVDNGAAGKTVRFYTAPTIAGPWTQLGAAVTTAGTTSIFSGAAPLDVGDVAGLGLTPPVGRYYALQVRNGIDGTLVADADFTTQTDGATGFTDGAGRVWSVVAPAEITNRRIRFVGEVSSWPARWDLSGADAWVPIQAAGILRRLGQGAKPLQSTLRRRIPAFSPLAYWPMEEQDGATRAYSPIPGVPPLTASGLTWAQADTLPASEALPTLAAGVAGQLPQIYGRIPAPTGAITGWMVEWVYRQDTPHATLRTYLRITSTGTVRQWYIQTCSTFSQIIGLDDDGVVIVNQPIGTGPDLYGQWIRAEFKVSQVGANTEWTVVWTDVGGGGGAFIGSVAGSVGRPTAVASPPDGYSTDLNGMALGHVAAFSGTFTQAYDGAIDAWAGETAGERMTRLSGEESVPLTVRGTVAEQEQVGPQRPAILLDLLTDAAEADGGVLYEPREAAELAYRDRASMYTQAPALALDYTAPGITDLEPTDDDQAVRNDITVVRVSGSGARAVLEDGPLSVQAPPDGVGVYDEQVTLNLHTDEQAPDQAGWRLHLGTWDEARYPTVGVELTAAQDLVDDAAAVDIGDRITVDHLPAFLPPGGADLLVHGYAETITANRWHIAYTCTPAGPWTHLGEVATVEDFEDTTYEVTITDGGTLPWTRTSAVAHTGAWSLRSGAITNNETSDAVLTLPDGAQVLMFWYRVSSEASGAGFEGDRLLVLVDGVQVLRAQGTGGGWTLARLEVDGASTVTFRYVKDNSASAGEDAAYIDNLTIDRGVPHRVDTDGSELAAGVDADDTTLTVATTAGAAPWTTDPAEMPIDVQVGGEVMRVTAISGTTSPQTFTVARAINGISKAHASGTDLRLATPAYSAL